MALVSFNDPKKDSKFTVPPFWSGKHASLKWFVAGSPTTLNVVSWNFKQAVTEGKDHVGGEPRARPWRVVDGYDINVTCRLRDAGIIRILLDAAKADDDDESNELAAQPIQHAIALVLKPLDGGRYGFMTSGIVTVGAWEIGTGGQTERNSMTLPFHSQNLNFVPV